MIALPHKSRWIVLKYSIYILPALILFFAACAERDLTNPFDAGNSDQLLPVSLWFARADSCIELNWSDVPFDDYSGFHIYRSSGTGQQFDRVASLAQSERTFTDCSVEAGQRYTYYLTIQGSRSESIPSRQLTTIPGPGYNWVLEKWSYQLRKLSYDCNYVIDYFYTTWNPLDFAITPDRRYGLITYAFGQVMEKIDPRETKLLAVYTGLRTPYNVIHDSTSGLFWITDSSGSLWSLDPESDRLEQINLPLTNPVDLAINYKNGYLYIVDRRGKAILQVDRGGIIHQRIIESSLGKLEAPERLVLDEARKRIWFTDRHGDREYLFTGTMLDSVSNITCIDSTGNYGDITLAPRTGNLWYVSYDENNSSVVQLSADGVRQMQVSGFYTPYDISVNPYDGTVLISDTRNYRVVHYDENMELIGSRDDCGFPVKVVIE